MEDLSQQLSEIVKTWRARRKWNQVQLSAASGVSLTVVQGVEQETQLPNLRTLNRLAHALGIELRLTASAPTEASSEEEASPTQEESEDERLREGDVMIVQAFRRRFPDPEHVAARSYAEEYPDVAAALARHEARNGR